MSATTPLVVRGSRLGGPLVSHVFRPYVYNGTDREIKQPRLARDGERICSADGCAGRHHAKGLCTAHYRRKLHGTVVDRRLKRFDPSACGTTAGYSRHRNHGVPLCQPCRDAKNKYDRQRYAGGSK